MRITTRGRYALRASLALAKLSNGGSPVSINQLSEEENISSVFLEQIFFKLRKAGIVTSVRGPGGGFCFAKPPDELSLKEILDAAGEETDSTNCIKHSLDCQRMGECLAHGIWLDINSMISNYLSGLTLSSVLQRGINYCTESLPPKALQAENTGAPREEVYLTHKE
ncbi:MAG: Rrf2 family transcriptional regulator [Treponema sp.]|nr:Rrf2 family transcriptional regulator [Treponema sp.]